LPRWGWTGHDGLHFNQVALDQAGHPGPDHNRPDWTMDKIREYAIKLHEKTGSSLRIPPDLDDAASVDGATTFRILWSIIVPLSRPALATAAILLFLNTWNDFLGPFIYLNDPNLFTMSVGLRFFQTVPETTGASKDNLLMAATVIMSIPAIALFFAAQRYFVRGIVMTGLKL
jgi:ABC-type glycerol-3-phosphate transport system permease component